MLFTDVVDALSDEPAAIDFYVGHELGHIHRKHLTWMAFLSPALLLPVLGTAYRRAQEYTCDRYGAKCCESEEHVRAALAPISAGDTRWKELNTNEYLEQIPATGGFWMSFDTNTFEVIIRYFPSYINWFIFNSSLSKWGLLKTSKLL